MDKNLVISNLKLGSLKKSQATGFLFLLTKALETERLNTLEKIAYVLATVYWETAHTFRPVTEYGSKQYLETRRYWPYIGRGYVQLTWEENYRKFGKTLGIDLVGNPSLANDPEIAWKILEIGMTDTAHGTKDADFTVYTLEDFFNNTTRDFYNARKIINPKDYKSYQPIADLAIMFYDAMMKGV